MKVKALTCSVCGNKFLPNAWDLPSRPGHNAQPVNDGRCCNDCNAIVVVPLRISRFYGSKDPA
jgi:hypothetical protein